MKVVLLCVNDWSNLSYILTQALKTAGVDAVSFKKCKHVFAYGTESFLFSQNSDWKSKVKDADVIQYMHSQHVALPNIDLSRKQLVVFHGGTKYRQQAAKVNRLFNPIVKLSIVQTGDLLNLGAKNEKWLLPPIDTDKLSPDYTPHIQQNGKPTFAHYPTKIETKGTTVIKSIISELSLKNNFSYGSPINWKEHMRRLNQCDIYIEMLCLQQAGKEYGAWGMSALEAAALGKIVVTNFLKIDRYKLEYGDCPLVVCNNATDLKNSIERLSTMSQSELLNKKKETRAWAERAHSYKAVGTRLKHFYEEV